MLNQVIDDRRDPELKGASGSCCSKRRNEPAQEAQTGIFTVLATYQPIIVIVGSALLGSLMLPGSHYGTGGVAQILSAFMGLFLFPLALLKLFDVRGFASAFVRYDIAAQLLPGYALIYPFLELALALAFLSGFWPAATHFAALVMGAVGTAGIVRTLSKGEKVQCACVGSTLKVPLGSVSIAENTGMAAMAVLLLII